MKLFSAAVIAVHCCVIVLLAGCTIEVPVEPESSGNGIEFEPVVSQPSTSDAPPVKEEFSSVEEGLRALIESSTDGNKKQKMAAYVWLSKQGPSAVDAVTVKMNDTSLPMEARRLACGVLGQLGPSATDALIAASKSDEQALKLRAIETLPAIDPPAPAAIKRLITLLDDPNDQIRHTAIRGLGRIGPPAKEAADKLNAMRDNIELSETTRHEAAKSLKEVRPIRTFED